MLHRLMHFPVVFFGFFLFLLLLITSGDGSFTSSAVPQGAPAKHGLTGNYYVGGGQWTKDTPPVTGGFLQIWSDPNDFMLPRTFSVPAATRVDAQVAFGQGKGFHVDPNVTFPPSVVWWPTGYTLPGEWAKWHPPAAKPWDEFAAVIWKGYIHLPKAGTYYFGTVSNGGSAVYLNQARVALNGMSGGVLNTDAFTYAKEQVQDFVQLIGSAYTFSPRPRDAYVLPVSIDGPRDLPIEVHYGGAETPSGHARVAFGADLFWVTPDSPRDASGKPIANIVPSDALYAEAPGPIEKPAVRTAHSTISTDHLYFPTQYVEESVTVTVRLADKEGNPIAGKRVYVSSLSSFGNSDAITQPDNPTDKNGETTAKIRANAAGPIEHDSTIFATDVSDFVDVAQVAHVTFQQVDWNFFTDAFSPYYDRRFSITPLPPVVGRPARIKTELKNHSKFPATVTVTFLTADSNIGFSNWAEIAKVKDLTLQPGASKEVSTVFTPKEVMGHKCYKVEVEGRYTAMNNPGESALTASLMAVTTIQAAALANPPDQQVKDSTQINTSTVAPPPDNCTFQLPAKGEYPDWSEMTPQVSAGCKPNLPQKMLCRDAASRFARDAYRCTQAALRDRDPQKLKNDLACARINSDLAQEYIRCWRDPEDVGYQHLAVAPTDTPSGYIEALTKSMERYQGARTEGDREWMARHTTAMELYENRLAQALRHDAEKLQKQAEQMPPDDPNKVAEEQAASEDLFSRVHHGDDLSANELSTLRKAGFSDQYARSFVSYLKSQQEPPQVKGPQELLLDGAKLDSQAADAAERLAAVPVNSGEEGKPGQPLMQAYTVANPHDKQENVDLFIRPISIPPDWKLSIVNAEQVEAGGQAAKPGSNEPKSPVREADPGKHYAVSLSAKAEIKVASVLVPVGEVGARTTARWAVEGKIGNELIGGMVHEMNVPYIIADLKLPPVGSKEEEEELPAPPKAWPRIVAEVAAAIVILGLLTYLFIFWRKRRGAGTS